MIEGTRARVRRSFPCSVRLPNARACMHFRTREAYTTELDTKIYGAELDVTSAPRCPGYASAAGTSTT
jgi:hypothetical protein